MACIYREPYHRVSIPSQRTAETLEDRDAVSGYLLWRTDLSFLVWYNSADHTQPTTHSVDKIKIAKSRPSSRQNFIAMGSHFCFDAVSIR